MWSAVCDLNFADAINAFSGGELLVSGPKATAGIFSTYPADYLSLWGGVVDQVGSYCHRSDTTKNIPGDSLYVYIQYVLSMMYCLQIFP